MDRIYQIEEFLKLMASAKKEGDFISKDVVYANLIYLGVDIKQDKIADHFDKWMDEFDNVDNILVFVDPGWRYFCQFINPKKETLVNNKAIKLYIPLDREHIDKGSKELFNYLAKENIPHISKIGSHIRFDDIVIRTDSEESANKIMNFVKNNPYIQEGLLPANPFAVNDNGIALSWDDMLSYNSVVANWVSDYINWEFENNNINSVSYARFYAYVGKKSYSLFEEGYDLQSYTYKLQGEGTVRKERHNYSIDAGLVNFYDVTRLMMLSLNPNAKKEDVYNFINKYANRSHNPGSISKMRRLRMLGPKQDISIKKEEKQVLFTEQQKAAFKLAYDYMCEKYSKEETVVHFQRFIETGNYDYITRYKGARELLHTNEITKKEAFAITAYWRCEEINLAIMTTYNKYGYEQVISALNHLVNYCDYTRFTNDNNSRVRLIEKCKNSNVLESIKLVLRNEGIDLPKTNSEICQMYIDLVIQKKIKQK